MRAVDVSIVTFRPDITLLEKLLASIAEQATGLTLNVVILDNSPDHAMLPTITALPHLQPNGAFLRVDIKRSPTNVGFGRGHNANAARCTAPFLFVLNQDCILEPGVLTPLLELAGSDARRVAAWELRQIPYEHPKAYDPVTLDVPWVSGAAVLFRRSTFDAVGGFDPALFMYGEDVDLSWRLRAKGFRLRYLPQFAVVHRTYAVAAEVKPLQVLGGAETNLCLRARYGGFARTLQGISMIAAEMLAPRDFPGRRRGLARALFRFLRKWPHFALTRVHPVGRFRPIFTGWGYEVRRDGAFVSFRSQREDPRRDPPLVSILIRTVNRGAWLRQALETVAIQTWPNIEAVVIEDGPQQSQSIVDEFRDRLTIRYMATGEKVGRARAGNLALAESRGKWLNFLDDDDVLFADHVEVLVDAVEGANTKGAYALSWETLIAVADRDRAEFTEIAHFTRHHQRFNRLILWHHNFLPIQSVLFHRDLFTKHGGFAEDMDQLEDWNLWTRFTLDDDFVLVEKTTSKYRVPAGGRDAADRQERLDHAYQDAVERQRALSVTLSPYEISQMAEDYVRSQSVVLVSRNDLRRYIRERPWLARIAAWRHPVTRRLKRRGATR
ncbi:MAG: glycosyltransferase family 2 protein [Betaproteobacteria bacterium]